MKLKEFITPLKAAFLLALVVHLGLINFLPKLLKESINKADLEINQQLSFSVAAAKEKAVSSSDRTNKESGQEAKETTKKKNEMGQNKQFDKQQVNDLKKSQEESKVKVNKTKSNTEDNTETNTPSSTGSNANTKEGITAKDKDLEKEITGQKDDSNKSSDEDKKDNKQKPDKKEKENQIQGKVTENNNQQNELSAKQELKTEKNVEKSHPQNKTKALKKKGNEKKPKKEIDLTEGSKAGVSPPSLVNYKPPSYPEQIKERGIEGRVILKVLVNQQGQVEKVKVEDTSGYEQLDLAAKKTVKKWEFRPGEKDNQQINTWILVPIKFKLRG